MFPATTDYKFASSTHTAQPPSGSSALITAAVSQSFKAHITSLSEEIRSKTIQETLMFIHDQFPNELPKFQETLDKRRITLAENSSETGAVSIRPLEKLVADHNCPELITDLNSMVKEFNTHLKHFINYSEDSEISSYLREHSSRRFSKQLEDFGKDIHKRTNQNCEAGHADSKVVVETQRKLVAWHNSVKILIHGLLDPLFNNPEGPDHNSREKDKALATLHDIQSLKQDVGKNDYFKIDGILRYLTTKVPRENICSRLSDLILTDFIGSGNLKVFQKTLQRLFDYYHFIPFEGPLGEITDELCESIQIYAAMKKPTGFDY
ncbi:hypothetical protein [Endozoicomonas sp. GU-1]|uniref:hypothetical protein n=1 Tax=Endozoicomonas sp. GU-1 TaxID=3009078 RepID=UPI0022B2DA08|nr:hypothetical protein [Endozoicomonas sp. GU-1]WBA83269.1 hypothetical protein O2T12_09185 [Endozoicomonas sp. GU-1]WBA86198.1 hypothetical protein O3276_23835 [Endozoicomonas sp. GU-1]